MTPPWRAWAEQRRLSLAYQRVFAGEDARLVLADLAVMCRETSTAVDEPTKDGLLDPMSLAREEGKRSVFLRIKNMLALDRGEIEQALRSLRGEILAEQRSTVNEARTGS